MVEECRSRAIPFACGDAWRNLPQFWKAREMIDSGELGTVVSINVHHPTTEISGGGCQSLSVMRLFAGDAEIDWVVGWTADDPFSDADQGMCGIVRFSNGIDGYYRSQRASKSGIEVVTTKAVFYSDWTGFHLSKVRDGADVARARWSDFEEVEGLFPATQGWGGSFEKNWTHMSTRQKESVQSIVDALEKGIEPRCNGDNMRNVLELGIAFRESHRRRPRPHSDASRRPESEDHAPRLALAEQKAALRQRALRSRDRLGQTPMGRPAPHRYVSKVVRPPDFDAFWEDVLAQAALVPMNVKVVPDKLRSADDVDVYEVFYDSLDHVRVAAWYCVPKDGRRPLPAILHLPGYQSDPPVSKEWARLGYATLTVAPRGKVRSNKQFNPGLSRSPHLQHRGPEHVLLPRLLRRRVARSRLPHVQERGRRPAHRRNGQQPGGRAHDNYRRNAARDRRGRRRGAILVRLHRRHCP